MVPPGGWCGCAAGVRGPDAVSLAWDGVAGMLRPERRVAAAVRACSELMAKTTAEQGIRHTSERAVNHVVVWPLIR